MIYLADRNISLYVKSVGTGEPILFLHGGPGADHSTMLPFKRLSKKYQLIFMDHRCNGRSLNIPNESMTWENLVKDIESLRKYFEIRTWSVVGHSFGGMVALEYGIKYSKNITNLFIVDGCGDANFVQNNSMKILEERQYSQKVIDTARNFYNGNFMTKEFIKSMIVLGPAYYSKPKFPLLLKEAIHGLQIKRNASICKFGYKILFKNWSVMEQLNKITCRTIIIAGEDDFQFPPTHQVDLKNHIINSSLHLIKNAGHNSHMEQNKQVVKIVLKNLESNLTTAST